MLRVKRKGTDDWFEFRNLDRRQAVSAARGFAAQWGREFVLAAENPGMDGRTADADDRSRTRAVPPSEFVAEWQDGNGDWDETRAAETIDLT